MSFLDDNETRRMNQKFQNVFEKLEIKIIPFDENNKDIDLIIAENEKDLMQQERIEENILSQLDHEIQFFLKKSPNEKESNLKRFEIYLKTKIILHQEKFKFLERGSYMEGFFWAPKSKKDKILVFFDEIQKTYQIPIQLEKTYTKKNPPTLFLENYFTIPFLNMDFLYSIPAYREINPAFFATVFFPFMFGIMYGDIAHGTILFLFSILIFLSQKSFSQDIREIKWLILLMGFFSIYCGAIYNDFFSISLPLFSTCYQKNDKIYIKKINCDYPFGKDWTWSSGQNEIEFINSFKMKTSIIFGIIHMSIAILMNGLNFLHFKHYFDFLFVFIPKITFMLSFFGYLCFCIVYKWFHNYSSNPSQAPSIISQFINFLSLSQTPLFESSKYQLNLQKILAVLATSSLLALFIFKPIYLLFLQKKDYKEIKVYQDLSQNENSEEQNLIQSEQTENIGEEIITHAIESIEFVLGSLSNTASYLRLWALSLAHQQLSAVFLQMIILPFLNGNHHWFIRTFFIILTFPFFLIVNVFVLIFMDCMECFLHALRLHWVEFQSKFVKGNGRRFQALSKKWVSSQFQFINNEQF